MKWLVRIFLALVAAAASLFCVCAGYGFVFEIPFQFATGWVWYLGRVVPKLNPDPAAVVTGGVCLSGVVLGGHLFFRWLYASTSDEPRVWPLRWTLRIVGLVVVMFVAGIAVTGLIHQATWLARSPEPLVRKDYGMRSTSMNNLKQIGLASHMHADVRVKYLPRSTFDLSGRAMHSWQTAILPWIEEFDLFKRVDPTKGWTHAANAGALQVRVKPYLNPLHPDEPVNGYAASHYAGNVHVVLGDRPKSLADFPRGAANTILAGEVASHFRAWGDPLNARDPRLGVNAHPDGFGARGRPPQFAMLDGSVRTFDPAELAAALEQATK